MCCFTVCMKIFVPKPKRKGKCVSLYFYLFIRRGGASGHVIICNHFFSSRGHVCHSHYLCLLFLPSFLPSLTHCDDNLYGWLTFLSPPVWLRRVQGPWTWNSKPSGVANAFPISCHLLNINLLKNSIGAAAGNAACKHTRQAFTSDRDPL